MLLELADIVADTKSQLASSKSNNSGNSTPNNDSLSDATIGSEEYFEAGSTSTHMDDPKTLIENKLDEACSQPRNPVMSTTLESFVAADMDCEDNSRKRPLSDAVDDEDEKGESSTPANALPISRRSRRL